MLNTLTISIGLLLTAVLVYGAVAWFISPDDPDLPPPALPVPDPRDATAAPGAATRAGSAAGDAQPKRRRALLSRP